MDPMSPGPASDPMGTMGSSPRSGAPKVFVILLAVLVVALFVGLGALVYSATSDDGGDDEEEGLSASEPAEEADDEGEPAGEDEAEPEPDTDGDGVPDTEDPDDDDDGVPDTEDPDDDGDGVPDTEEPGGPDDGGEGGGEGGGDGDGDGGDGDGGEEEPPIGLDLLTNSPRPAIDAWTEEVGDDAKAIRTVLYPTYGFLQVRDPAKPQEVVEYGWRDGVVDGPESVDVFPGTDLDAESYRIDAVNWDALPGLVAEAPERARLPNGEVTHVIVESDLPFSSRFIIRIYVTAPNGSDYVVATIDGHPAPR